jgi:hypothetical protein
MKKKEKSRKNVFGLVSKLGNLIKKGGGTKNTDNIDTSAGEDDLPKKNFNIHISEDNQEQIEIDDDEEEEEEEDETEKEVKKDVNEKKEDKIENQNNIQTKVEENINNEKIIDNANNINNEKVNNETSNKEEKKQENNIINNTEKTNEKINTAKEEGKESNNIILNDNNEIDINSSTKEDSKPQENIDNQIKEDFENMKEENIIENINEACHLYLKKGNDFNAKEIYCIPITQIKNRKKKSLLQKMNVFKKVKNEVISYKIFMEENFLYFAKDIIIDKKNDDLRRIYKVYNIRNILNYTSSKESENSKYKIVFEMVNKKFVNKSKEYFIEEQYFKAFNNEVMKKLKIYGDKFIKK